VIVDELQSKNLPRRPDDYERVLTGTEIADLSRLPRTEKCVRLQYFRNFIKSTADAHDLKRDGHILGITVLFAREVSLIQRLQKEILNTQIMHEWVYARTLRLARRMQYAISPQSLEMKWGKQSRPQRLAKLRNFAQMQCNAFMQDDIFLFKPGKISYAVMQNCGQTDAGMTHLLRRTRPNILVSHDLITGNNPLLCLETVFHEQLHVILLQLASAAWHGEIPRTHPLYEDAHIILDRLRYASYVSTEFGKAYETDPDEALCLVYDSQFTKLYTQPSHTHPRSQRPFLHNMPHNQRFTVQGHAKTRIAKLDPDPI
jgi:hypothetical protein